MKLFRRGLLLLLVIVFATACATTNSGTMTSSNLDRIAQAGVLRVGTAANMPPLNMLDKSGVPMGLDVDLAEYMAGAMGVELSLVIKPFPELLPALEAGEVDMVISGLTITPERNMKVDFVGHSVRILSTRDDLEIPEIRRLDLDSGRLTRIDGGLTIFPAKPC